MRSKIYLVKALTLIIALLAFMHTLSGCAQRSSVEFQNEMADLQGMYGAKLTAMLQWKDRLPDESVKYWYNPNGFTLSPATDPMPAPCGLGTAKAGGAVEAFTEETGEHFVYDEHVDYTDKVLCVVVRNKSGELDVRVEWVDADLP